MIDGDDFREIIGRDLGHTNSDRMKNAWRIVKMCKYLCDQNVIVICATISLYNDIHTFIYQNFENPLIVYLDVDIEELKTRNKNLLYSNANNVLGVDLEFDKPQNDKYVMTIKNNSNIDTAVNQIIEKLKG
jgi:adenylylsulfate kinase-like enzyme